MKAALLLWGGLVWAASAPGAQEAYEAGIAALRAGQPAEATAHFSASLEAGGHDPAVYHGLGNALYRQGRRGAAMAAWQRGLALAPSNGDLAANLARARGESVDALPPPAQEGDAIFWRGWLADAVAVWLASLLSTVGLAGLALALARRTGAESGVALFSGGLVVLAGLLLAPVWWEAERTAVVVVPSVTAQSDLGGGGGSGGRGLVCAARGCGGVVAGGGCGFFGEPGGPVGWPAGLAAEPGAALDAAHGPAVA